jgi:DNA-binding response OmpR family regulator
MNGLAFFRRIRRDHPHTIKILCGESSDTAVVAETFKNRIHDFLLKPFPFKILLATLCMHMRKRRQAAPDRQAARPRKAHCTASGDAHWQIS